MIVAIDGPAGVGKSTIAALIAQRLDLYYLNSGSFYRGVTYQAELEGVDPLDQDAVLAVAEHMVLSVTEGKVCNKGIPIEDKLHTSQVDRWVAQVSIDPRLRKWVNKQIRSIAMGMDMIAEGRDITTVVFPDADFKFYFDATPEVRARRRYEQHPQDTDYKSVLDGILARDRIDKEKAFGGLKIAKDAVIIDTSYLTISEVCEKVVSAINSHNMRRNRKY
ncbi:MAG: (d)CMP kinase [Spirochaetia bacterium]|jgi:cytidylate kinase|nr:(d)CMP kinase [Spirochaetia bacterium]